MIYFVLSFLFILSCLVFTASKGGNLKVCTTPILIYLLFLFFISYCVIYYRMSLFSYIIILILSCFLFIILFSFKMLQLYILTLKSFYLFIVSFTLVFSLSELILNKNVYLILNYGDFRPILFAVCLLIYFIFEALLHIYFKEEKLNYLFSSLKSFIPISIFILLIGKNFSIFYVLLFSKHALSVSLVILASTLLELSFSIFALIGISNAYTLSIYRHKNKILNMQYDLQMANLNRLEDYQIDIRRISHDIANHKSVLHKLIIDGDYTNALNYLDVYGTGFANKKDESITSNKILNAILISKNNICIENNITMSLDIQVPTDFGISDFDLCIIIGNLIDNAIEACKKVSSNPFINIKCTIINDNFIFDMQNSFNGKVSINSNRFITSKKDKLNHGLGISNVHSTVNNYLGTCSLTFEDNIFSSFVMIPINK